MSYMEAYEYDLLYRLCLEDMINEFSEKVERLQELGELLDNKPNWEEDISGLKKRIKHCKNPMEKKQLQKKLDEVYKTKKRHY